MFCLIAQRSKNAESMLSFRLLVQMKMTLERLRSLSRPWRSSFVAYCSSLVAGECHCMYETPKLVNV